MDPLNFYIDLGASGILDIADYIKPEFQVHEAYHSSSYGKIKNSAKFTVSDPSGSIVEHFMDVADNFIPVVVFSQGESVFVGYIRNNFSATTKDVIEDFQIELIDKSKDLEVEFPSSIELETEGATTIYVCDTSNPDNSIIHQLLLLAGFGTEYVYGYTDTYAYGFSATEAYGYATADLSGLTDILVEYDYFFKSKFTEDKISDVIDKLLFECGYVLNIDVHGNPYFASIIQRSETPSEYTFTNNRIFKGFSAKRNDVTNNSVTGKYYTHETVEKATVFEDTTDGTNDWYRCFIPVKADGDADGEDYYPVGVDNVNTTTRLEFQIENREIIVAKYDGAYMVYLPVEFFEIAKTWSADDWYGDSVDNGVHNKNVSDRTLITFQIIADVILKGDMHEVKRYLSLPSVNSDEEIEFEYIYDDTTVKTVVEGMLENYVMGKYTYNFGSDESFTLGNYYNMTDNVFTSIVYPIKLLKKIHNYYWDKVGGLVCHDYKYEGISFGTVVYAEANDIVTPSDKSTGSRSIFSEANLEGASNPEPPYRINDTWITDDGTYVCSTPRYTGSYVSTDWERIIEDVAHTEAVAAQEILESPNILAARKNYDVTNTESVGKILFHGVDHIGNVDYTSYGRVTYGEGYQDIKSADDEPLDVELTEAEVYYYIFYATTTQTLLAAQYDFTLAKFQYSGGNMPAGLFIAEAYGVTSGADISVSSVDIYQTAKSEREMETHFYSRTMQILANASPEDFGDIADGLGIEASFTSLAAYQAFITKLFSNEITITEKSAGVPGYIQSDGFTSGSGGFKIDSDGNSEFNNTTIRGTIYANDGEFSGVLTAASGQVGGFVSEDAGITGKTYTTAYQIKNFIDDMIAGGLSKYGGTIFATYNSKSYIRYERLEKFDVRSVGYNYTYYFYASDGTSVNYEDDEYFASNFVFIASYKDAEIRSMVYAMAGIDVEKLIMSPNASIEFETTAGNNVVSSIITGAMPVSYTFLTEAYKSSISGSIRINYSLQNNHGSSQTLRFKIYVGSTEIVQISQSVASSATYSSTYDLTIYPTELVKFEVDSVNSAGVFSAYASIAETVGPFADAFAMRVVNI